MAAKGKRKSTGKGTDGDSESDSGLWTLDSNSDFDSFVILPALESGDKCPFKKAKDPQPMDVALARSHIMEAFGIKGSSETPKDLDKFIKKVARAGQESVDELYTACGGKDDNTLSAKVDWLFQRLVGGTLVPI